jgi:hypothetical protein
MILPATYPKRTRLSASSFFFPLPPCLPEMSFTGNNASVWSCKLREHSSAAICALWFPLEQKRIPKRFCCCRFLGRMRNSIYESVSCTLRRMIRLLSSRRWFDWTSIHSFFLFFLSSFLSCMHLLIRRKTKFGSVVCTLFPFGKGTKKALRQLLVLQVFRVTGTAAYSFNVQFPTATLYQILFSTSCVHCFRFV